MAGIGKFTHFVGYVVAREDGQNLGRVKVKALGFHDLDPAVVSADDLPWAPVVDGTYGAVTTIPLVGEWVLGAFLDGAEGQHPIVLGRIPGYNSQAPAGTDTNGTEEAEFTSDAELFGKFPLHPAMGGEGIDEIEGILAAATQVRTQDQKMVDAYNREHEEELGEIPERDLDNRVLSSKGDQQYVLLTEEGCLQIVHHTGSIIQFNDDGDILIKTTGQKGIQQMVGGGVVEDTMGDVNTMIGQDYTLKVDMNGKMYFGGDLDIECENFTLTSRGETTINSGAKMILNTHADMQQHSANDFNIVSESKFKLQSVDLTTIQADNNGIYLYATGGNNNIDMTSGSMRFATEIKSNPEVEGIAEAGTHHLGQIDIQSANNLRIETKGTPADTPPSSAEIEDSEGYIDIKSSAGMRLQTSGGDLSSISSANTFVKSGATTSMTSTGTTNIHATGKLAMGSAANTHVRGTQVHIDDYVYMASGGADSAGTILGQHSTHGPASSLLAEIASTTRTIDASGDEDKKQTVIALGVNKEDFKEGNLVLHGAAPTPPKSQGEGKGFKQKDQVGTIPNPTNTNPPVTTTPGVED
jgi:hypothetical protein